MTKRQKIANYRAIHVKKAPFYSFDDLINQFHGRFFWFWLKNLLFRIFIKNHPREKIYVFGENWIISIIKLLRNKNDVMKHKKYKLYNNRTLFKSWAKWSNGGEFARGRYEITIHQSKLNWWRHCYAIFFFVVWPLRNHLDAGQIDAADM